jgi:formylglycine-generating enzyme required for sulfatase activity/serine/threonine protein kinase
MPFYLLQCVARAAAKHGVKFLLHLVPGGEVVYDIAADAWADYCQHQQADAARADVQALAQAPPDQVRREVLAAVQAVADQLPPEAQQPLSIYLSQVPALIRRSLRRPSDPTGTTVPANLSLRGPEDLLPFLPPRAPRFQPGDRPLPGVDWVLEDLVGVGGFGEVWKARHAHLRSKPPVALKFCLDRSAVAALRNEAGVLDRVMQHGRHPGVVPLLQTYLSADPPCLEYEYVEGGDLGSLIQEMHANGQVTPEAATGLLLQLAEVVAAAHQADPPIVHGDLKPANVLVQRSAGGTFVLRITDFGIGGLAVAQAIRATAHPTRSRQELLTEAVRGAYTPLYASAEQMVRRRGEAADPRDDVHALGVIWYQLLTGDLGMLSVPSDWREEVQGRGLGEELVGLLGACLAAKALKRPDGAVVLADTLKGSLHPMPPSSSPRPTPPNSERQPREMSSSPRPTPLEPDRRPGEVFRVSLGKVRQGRVLGFGGKDVEVSMVFGWCPPGTFLMGSPSSEEGREDDETEHRVTLTKGFYIGVHPVTQAQWQAVMGDNPTHFKGADRPVEQMSWGSCQLFCKILRQRDGKTYRLPTEAEWEYACRAGTTTPFSFGYTIGRDQANYTYDGNYTDDTGEKGVRRQQTTPVGSFPANAWGLTDMHGNVWEWCQDRYGPYPEGDLTDYKGVKNGDDHVLRGGSWRKVARRCRSACRDKFFTDYTSDGGGFRVILCLD